jgi:hypothetical protein
MLMKIILVLAALVLATPAIADVVRPACETPESASLRAEAWAFGEAAKEMQDGTPPCPPNAMCSMSNGQSALYNANYLVKQQMLDKARANILHARAIESVKCPTLAEAIRNNMPSTPREHHEILVDFEKRQAVHREFDAKMDQWRSDHPQCKSVLTVRQLVDGKPTNGWRWPNDGKYEQADLTGKDNGICRAGPMGDDGAIYAYTPTPWSNYVGQGPDDKPLRAKDHADSDCRSAYGDYWFGDAALDGGQPTAKDCAP